MVELHHSIPRYFHVLHYNVCSSVNNPTDSLFLIQNCTYVGVRIYIHYIFESLTVQDILTSTEQEIWIYIYYTIEYTLQIFLHFKFIYIACS